MNNEDDSSEGIVASSDDELDGLSKAVGHHIFNRASPPRRGGEFQPHQRRPPESHDNTRVGTWRRPLSPAFYDERFSYLEDYRRRRFNDEVRKTRDWHCPPQYLRSRPRGYGEEEAPPSRVQPTRGFDGPESSKIHGPPLPLMHRPAWRHGQLLPHQQAELRDIYHGEKAPLRGREVRYRIHANYAENHHELAVLNPRYQPRDTDRRVRDTDHRIPMSTTSDNVRERFSHHGSSIRSPADSNLNRDRPSRHVRTPPLSDLINESLLHYGDKAGKMTTKPVSFKIKSTKSEEKSFQPLDRLGSPLKSDKTSSPERWLHDKYEEQDADNNQESSRGVEAKNGNPKEKTNSGDIVEAQKIVPTENSSSAVLHQSGTPDGLIHAKKDSDVVYEIVETITEEAECTETNKVNESSEDDEELLGLRLEALSSALDDDKKMRNITKKKSSRKKRLKNLIHRVHDSPQSGKKKSVRSKRGGAAESSLIRYPSLSSEKSKPTGSKSNPSQLTLLGEMVKNHHPTAALKNMKDIPVFKRSSQSATHKFDQRKTSGRIETREEESEKPELKKAELVPPAISVNKTGLVDNYDEMEMDLEADDGASDSSILPPGVDQDATKVSTPQASSSVSVPKLLNVAPAVQQAGNSTPSQESIWSMLEQSAPCDSQSIAEDNHEQLKIGKIETVESRRMSFEEYDDDDAILKLRQSLLRQLDKNIQKDADNDHQPPADEANTAPLPSQFPYKPPELKIISAAISTTVSSVSSVSTLMVPAVTTTLATSCIQTFTARTVPVMSVAELRPATPTQISTSSCSHDSTPKALADTSINIQPASAELCANTPRVFAPQTASTPAADSQTPALRKKVKRRSKRKRSTSIQNPGPLIQKAGGVLQSGKIAPKPKKKSNILRPTVTNVAIVSKKADNHSAASKTLVKTATTIIRSTASRPTPAATGASNFKLMPSPSKDTLQQMKGSNERPRLILKLPRHQPVVVNISSSDEEESVVSPTKSSLSQKDPVEIQRSDVTEMIKQMRVLATARQNASNEMKNISKQLDVTQKSTHDQSNSPAPLSLSQKMTNAAKSLKFKYVKLEAMIKNDEIRLNQVEMAREAKKVEWKAIEDELKQMMHRVAAIRSKKNRCQESLSHFSKQEKLLRNRLQKKNALRKKIGAQLQNHLNRSKLNNVSMKRTKKNVLTGNRTSQELQSSSSTVTKLDQEKQRLLARQQKLAEKINQMKKTETPATVVRKRSSLSKEVQSHLAKYRKTRTSSNPTAHDLSLNKIAISTTSPAKQSSPGLNLSRDVGNPDKPESPESLEPDCSSVEDSEPTTLSDASLKMRKIVTNSITAYKPFAFCEPVLSYESKPFAAKFWEPNLSVSIQRWKVSENDIPSVVKVQESQAIGLIDMPYQSPLRLFRSYRLSPFLRVKEKVSIKSATFSHKIDPKKILCRYDLSGKCQDPNCKAQHANEYQLSTDELILDLLLYSPSLFSKKISSDLSHDSLIKMSQSACKKLLGLSTARTNMSVDEKCILIASRVNSNLENRATSGTICKPRSIKLRQNNKKNLVSPASVHNEKLEMPSCHLKKAPEEPDSNVEKGKRYFQGNDECNIEKLEAAIKKDPKSIQLWLKLTDRRIKTKDPNRSELALHTMCLSLEQNPFSGELWENYLNLLHARKGERSTEDLDDMVSQAIELVPLSTRIWDLLLSWESNIMKMQILLDQLVSNIVKYVEESEGSREEHPPEFLSRWLLETILRKVQLMLYQSSIDDVLDQFSHVIDSFMQQRAWSITNSTRHCLMPNDFAILRLCFINIKHFKCLPKCFLLDVRPFDSSGIIHSVKVHGNTDVQLHFSSGMKCQDIFSALLNDLDVSIQDCKIGAEVNMACFPLLWEKLRLLRTHDCWDEATSLCRMMFGSVQQSLLIEDLQFGFSVEKLNRILSDCVIISADCLAKLGNSQEATQMFENAINDNKMVDGKLCLEAALFQKSVDPDDIEAVLVYLEACVASMLKLESECLDANSLKLMLKYLLGWPVLKRRKIPEFIDGVSWATVEKAKPALWLMDCFLLQITGASHCLICHRYEHAILEVADLSGKRELWLRYIRYKQALALSLSGTDRSKQQQWIRKLCLLVKRCLTTMSPHLSSQDEEYHDRCYSDYTFHNQVAAVFLDCFSTRQELASAYSFLLEIMPYNSLLILRACKFHLTHGDHDSVVSTVWKITANTKCQNETLWKISISSHFLTGRIDKAVRLAKQAVESVPFSSLLWSDYLSLLKAFGMPAEFVEEKVRCTNILQVDASRLIIDS